MEQTFYVNTLFGKNRQRIFDEMKKKFLTTNIEYRFQINPYRISPLSELSENSRQMGYLQIRHDIQQHLTILNDINKSGIDTINRPFENIIFVNYTTKELEPALRFDRIKYYLCDYINDDNIELVTMSNLIYINFFNKIPKNKFNLNAHFMTYSTLVCHDTNADNRIFNPTTLDIGEETNDDVTYILQTRLNSTHISDDDDDDITKAGIILPYHPFRQSMFVSIQNIKDNINAILISRNKKLIYFPFDQIEWLKIIQHISYEHVLLNYLVTHKLYENERFTIHDKLSRNIVACCIKNFNKLLAKNKTQILNDVVFDYKNLFKTKHIDKRNWLKRHYFITNIMPQFSTNFLCLNTSNGILI